MSLVLFLYLYIIISHIFYSALLLELKYCCWVKISLMQLIISFCLFEDKTSEFSKHYSHRKSDSFHVGRSERNKQVVHFHTVYLSSVLVGDRFFVSRCSFPWMISSRICYLSLPPPAPLPFKRCKCQLMADRKWVLWEQHKVCSTRAVMSSWEEAAVNMKGLCAAVLLHSYFTTHPWDLFLNLTEEFWCRFEGVSRRQRVLPVRR